jgi:hypothetical protein
MASAPRMQASAAALARWLGLGGGQRHVGVAERLVGPCRPPCWSAATAPARACRRGGRGWSRARCSCPPPARPAAAPCGSRPASRTAGPGTRRRRLRAAGCRRAAARQRLRAQRRVVGGGSCRRSAGRRFAEQRRALRQVQVVADQHQLPGRMRSAQLPAALVCTSSFARPGRPACARRPSCRRLRRSRRRACGRPAPALAALPTRRRAARRRGRRRPAREGRQLGIGHIDRVVTSSATAPQPEPSRMATSGRELPGSRSRSDGAAGGDGRCRGSSAGLQVVGAEALGQQLAQGVSAAQAAGVGHQHRQLVVGKLAQLLPAAAAGRAGPGPSPTTSARDDGVPPASTSAASAPASAHTPCG